MIAYAVSTALAIAVFAGFVYYVMSVVHQRVEVEGFIDDFIPTADDILRAESEIAERVEAAKAEESGQP